MDSMTGTRAAVTGRTGSGQQGFTLVETLMAIIILSGGLLALSLAFAQGMVVMSTSHFHQVAKEKASEAIESVFTSRDTRTISWGQIRNVGNGGVFLDGPQPLLSAGPDGLVNTGDDGPAETEILAGPDRTLGTADDVVVALDGFTREVIISDLAPNLREIRVVVTYRVGFFTRTYQLTTYISSFA